jgi:hypothetical protein
MAKKKGTILHIQKGQNEDILKYLNTECEKA